ncbi:hypothetical protein HYFRA_00007532 [Hymenoscyphus fraxineus]|uniref:Methyltransferase domain-containing protein n=1 Tax=Hymenoscyphus fraxineus TaxID=746836 RepID=A0A9N9PHA2_9HELO|nr:hypothetical protein HYFRA_00007532 [Hymenoscyphus fraxineus]
MATSTSQEDHWDSNAYQSSASFVPKLATKVVSWMSVDKDDVILDLGCGDGVLNIQMAQVLASGTTGRIHGVDSSAAMIEAAKEAAEKAGVSNICTFDVLDATKVIYNPSLANGSYNKVFSNAAMHWILTPEATRNDFFKGVHAALKPGGIFVFEMGGMGNCAEMRSTFLALLAPRIGIEAARAVDPWFFPDKEWMKTTLEANSFQVEKLELEYRPTKADKGGILGWSKLMGKQFFDAVEAKLGKEEREKCEREAASILKTVCASQTEGGGDYLGYVRLRGYAVKKA